MDERNASRCSARLSTIDSITKAQTINEEKKNISAPNQERKVLSDEDSSTDKLILLNLVQTKKSKSGASVSKPKKEVILKESSSESSNDIQSNQENEKELPEEKESDDEVLFKHE